MNRAPYLNVCVQLPNQKNPVCLPVGLEVIFSALQTILIHHNLVQSTGFGAIQTQESRGNWRSELDL